MAPDRTVYIVHCIDTEGPLYESVEATFERLEKIFGLHLTPSQETLRQLQVGTLDLGGLENSVAEVVAPELLDYNADWHRLDAMLDRIAGKAYRDALPDSSGGGWVYNWHCVDHVGYLTNPRRKDIGFHNIFDHYRSLVREQGSRDEIHWHFHPMHPSRCSHESATNYFRDTRFFEILARRLIDRNWFPSINRAGFHTERPDSHWLLEQWIPFDISNQACRDGGEQPDLAAGRFGDWRRAPDTWEIYQPSHDDYQVPGNCRRYIARCLNLGTRHRLLTEREVRRAFDRARGGNPTILAFTSHDFRDLSRDVDSVRLMLERVVPDYSDVRFCYSEAREAMNKAIFGEYDPPRQNVLQFKLEEGTRGSRFLTVDATEPIFGPQPFLALRTTAGQYLHENLDFQIPFRKWTYVFDDHSFPWNMLDAVVIGTNDRRGFPHILDIKKCNG